MKLNLYIYNFLADQRYQNLTRLLRRTKKRGLGFGRKFQFKGGVFCEILHRLRTIKYQLQRDGTGSHVFHAAGLGLRNRTMASNGRVQGVMCSFLSNPGDMKP